MVTLWHLFETPTFEVTSLYDLSQTLPRGSLVPAGVILLLVEKTLVRSMKNKAERNTVEHLYIKECQWQEVYCDVFSVRHV